MIRIAWENRDSLPYAWRILSRGVCDGCALGTKGLRDWTLDGTHLCLVRLNLLRLNTMGPLDPGVLSDVPGLRALSARDLRALGRLPYPMRRRAGEVGFTRVSWDEAIADLGTRIARIDPKRLAIYMTSRGITNEVYYATQKAARYLGCPNIDNAARLCHSPSTRAMKRMLGVGASTVTYKDWYGTDLVIFFGSNPANDQPVALKYLYEAKKLGTRVLSVNPFEEPGMRRYWIPSSADSALFGTKIVDRLYRVNTGGDLSFFTAVARRLIERDAIDRAFVDAHVEGYDEWRKQVMSFDVDTLAKRAGTTAAEVDAFAEELAKAKNAVFVWSMGLTQHAHGTATVEGMLALALVRGFIGREKSGVMPIRGHSGVQGGAEMGAYATSYPMAERITPEGADELEKTWGFRPPAEIGLDTVAMVEAAGEGRLDVFYSIGGNFLDTLPQPERVAAALEKVPVRIHQDIVVTPQMLLDPADVVYLLPAKTRYEHDGGVTETTTERRVVLSPKIPGPVVGEAKEEWWIPMRLIEAARPEKSELIHFDDAAQIRADIARSIPQYRGIEKLVNGGDSFQWGGERLCEGAVFAREGGKAHLVPPEPPERALREGELLLSTRRGKQFNSIVQRDHDSLTGADRDHVLISEDDLHERGLRSDQAIVVISEHGSFRGRAFAAPITPGNVQMHWPEANVLLAANRVDPSAIVPDYNCVVRIEPASPQ
jgi:molybdopterin-dependent oxidoreductase alpha subunit